MEFYVLKSALCILFFYAFYKGLLESTSLHRIKRVYLLSALVLSLGIPFITFTVYIEPNTASNSNLSILQGGIISEEKSVNYLAVSLWTIYGIGVTFFGIRFLKNLARMIVKIVRNQRVRSESIVKVLLNERIIPHTFFSFIFLDRERYLNHQIPKEVIAHERTHARELHSADVLISEMICVLFWFNPLVHLWKNAIKLNHEFLADRSVLNRGTDRADYQKILLAYSSSASSPQLANSINYYSSTLLNKLFSNHTFGQVKKRFTVMKSNTSKRAARLKLLLLLPLLALLIFSFSSREVIELPAETDPLTEFVMDSSEEMNYQTSATREEMREYTKLAKKYNNMSKDNMFIKKKELERMEYIYQKMSPKQRADAEPFPKLPPPPPAPEAPEAPKAVSIKGTVQPTQPNAPKEPMVASVSKVSGTRATNPVPPKPPKPPKAPQLPKFDVKELISQGAAFFLNDNRISNGKALELEKNLDDLKTINVVKGKDGKPEVYFTK